MRATSQKKIDRNLWRWDAGYRAGKKGQKFTGGGHPVFMEGYAKGIKEWQEQQMMRLLNGKV